MSEPTTATARDVIARILAHGDGEFWSEMEEHSPRGWSREDYRKSADTFLAALQAAGWAVVPVVATEEMLEAGDAEASESISDSGGGSNDYSIRDLPRMWTAMIAAAR